MRRIVVSLVLACAATLASPAGAQTPLFRSGVDLATFSVTVMDRKGQFITDLSPDDFEILEDGKPQSLNYFARGTEIDAGPEMHVGLLFDTSGSMSEDIKLSRSAAVKFLNTLQDAVDMTLVDFDTEVRVAKYGQTDFPRVVERIRGRAPDGETALYDAMGVYLDGATGDDGRKILVVYTDGGDTRSTINFADVMTLLKASDVTIFSVGFLEHSRGAATDRNRLMQLAEASGGQSFFPSSMKDVDAAYEKVVQQIRAQYTIAFTSTNGARDGAWRKVEVKVRKPGVSGAKILARKGYYAPYEEKPGQAKPK